MGSQPYVEYRNSVSVGRTVNVKYNGTTVYNTKCVKQINYAIYSSPDMSSASGWSITVDDSALIEEEPQEYDCAVSGHVWNDGDITTQPTCAEPGIRTFTCKACGATTTQSVPVAAHNYVNGYCAYCGAEDPSAVWYTVTFVTDAGASITTYETQTLENPAENAVTAIARNGDTGKKDITGNGQSSFAVNVAEGYELVSVTADANYKNLKTTSDTGNSTYRLTKITGNVTVTVVTNQVGTVCGHEYENGYCVHCGEEDPNAVWYTVTFVTDTGATVSAYETQNLTGAAENASFAIARDGDTGKKDISGNGQSSFAVNVAEGYELVSVTADANYKNLKTPADTGNGTYRLTKITGNVVVTVVTEVHTGPCEHEYVNGYCTKCGEENPDAEWYTVTFVTDAGASITTYETQTLENPAENAVTAIARDGDTGKKDMSGNGQSSFAVNVAEGYELVSVTADANYKNLKLPAETGNGTYRLTKITRNVTVTVVTNKTGTVCEHEYENCYCVHCGEEDPDAVWYTVTFVTDAGAAITTYETQTLDNPAENAVTAIARNSATGKKDITGDGQANFAVIPAEGYDIVSVTADSNYKNLKTPEDTGNGTYRLTKITGDVTVTMVTKKTESEPDTCSCWDYTDVDRTMWYHSAVDYVIENGLMGSTRTDALTFEPATRVSRAMVASILYRIAGSPSDVKYKASFLDVKDGRWYTTAVEWAAQNGLAAGRGNGMFDPDGDVTRQELAVFMMKMAEFLGRDTSGRDDLTGFEDAASVPAWAKTYVQWAVSAGIISGKSDSGKLYLAPADNAARSEFASVIMRFTSC